MSHPAPSANPENAKPAQVWSAAGYAHNARFVAELGAEVGAWLAPQVGERILDLGCGDGALTEKLVAAGAQVVGVDPSAELLAAAAARGLHVQEADAQSLPFVNEFDAVFSNAVLHWVPRLDLAASSVFHALRPGGRFVGEFGGHGNIAAVCTALRAVARANGVQLNWPWTYPTLDEFSTILSAAGFTLKRIALIPRPTPLPTGMEGWLKTFAQPLLTQCAPHNPAQALEDVVSLLAGSLRDSAGRWSADYVRLRFEAVKSA